MPEGVSEPIAARGAGQWRTIGFRSVEAFTESVRQARPDVAWAATQLSPGPLLGSVGSLAGRGARIACTRVTGAYELRGPLSTCNPVLALGLRMIGASSMWMEPVSAGSFGLIQANHPTDTVIRGEALYLTMEIPLRELEAEAELQGLVIDRATMLESGLMPSRMPEAQLLPIVRQVERAMGGGGPVDDVGARLDDRLLEALVGRIGREPVTLHAMPQGGYGRIVARARAYIESHLEGSISIDEIAAAGFASRRTLHRAFHEILGETPHGYVLKLRLNRIRQELAGAEEARRTITMVAHKWGLPELGRMAAHYREQFGELPSETLARHCA